MSNQLLFSRPQASAEPGNKPLATESDRARWTVLIVDDEEYVHELTRLILTDFEFEGKPLELLEAFSGEQAMDIIGDRDDIALILLDVVMETDHAGLDVARFIREEMHNHYTRIVLRTGQPGHAPEASVIRDYDIDDYKDKTELTDIKLFTVIYSALRSYRDICTLDRSRRGLEKIIRSSMEIFQSDSMYQFASAMLSQIINMLSLSSSALYCTSLQEDQSFKVLAATGEMTSLLGEDDFDDLPEEVKTGFRDAMEQKQSIFGKNSFVGYYKTTHGSESLLFISHDRELSPLDRQLLEIYSANVAIGYENLLMQDEIVDTQRELVYILGDAVEERSRETGAHVKRIAHICHLLALKYGLSADEAELIQLASPLHDVGKVGIPDSVLNKPGKHNQQEWDVMKSHAALGQDLLGKSNRRILKLAAIIAGQHHEKWDGSGYPNGLKGEEIHVAGRICSLADVFDALGSKRCYKEPWPLEKIMELIKNERGRHFDPRLVDVFLENIDELVAIRTMNPDS